MQNVETYEGWEALLNGAGARQLEALAFDLDTGGMRAMLAPNAILLKGPVTVPASYPAVKVAE